jgi:citrate lyase alpha subunit
VIGVDQMGTTAWATAPASTTEQAANQVEEESGREHSGGGGVPRYSRRLSDKIIISFHHACDQGDFEVAEQLLHILEMMLTRRPLTPDGTRRRNMESLVAAHERLWHLRHPDTDQS